MRLILTILTLVWASQSHAGAWLRQEGTGFVSVSVFQNEDGQSDGAFYLEYGLRPNLTLGLKADANMVAGLLTGGSAFAFARLPIPTGERPFKLAYDIGLGATLDEDTEPLLRTGFSYGRGFSWKERSGWLALDVAVEWSLGDADHTAKFDTTLGVGVTDKVKAMMQVFVSNSGDSTSVTVAPSLIWQPRAQKPSYQIGFEAERGVVAVRLGLWKEF